MSLHRAHRDHFQTGPDCGPHFAPWDLGSFGCNLVGVSLRGSGRARVDFLVPGLRRRFFVNGLCTSQQPLVINVCYSYQSDGQMDT